MKRRNLKLVAKKFQKKLKKIKVAVFDVDGILTPAFVFWDGQEIGWNRHFNVYDGYGMNLLREAGLKVAIITGGNSDGVRRRFTENLKVDYLMMGNEDKREGYKKVKEMAGVKDEEIMYIGDELFDIPLLQKVGFSATVPNAPMEVIGAVDYVTERGSGEGCGREVIDLIRYAQNLKPNILEF